MAEVVGLAEAVAALQAELARAAAGAETGFQFPVTGSAAGVQCCGEKDCRGQRRGGVLRGGAGWLRQLRSGRDPDSDADTGGAGRSDRAARSRSPETIMSGDYSSPPPGTSIGDDDE